jgi:hypothetical protein
VVGEALFVSGDHATLFASGGGFFCDETFFGELFASGGPFAHAPSNVVAAAPCNDAEEEDAELVSPVAPEEEAAEEEGPAGAFLAAATEEPALGSAARGDDATAEGAAASSARSSPSKTTSVMLPGLRR